MMLIIVMLLMFVLAFFAAKYVKIFKDYGSNILFFLAILFLIYGMLDGFTIWILGWILLWMSMFKNVKLGVD